MTDMDPLHTECRSHLPPEVVTILASLNESLAQALARLMAEIRQLDGSDEIGMERLCKIAEIQNLTTAAQIQKKISVGDRSTLVAYASGIPQPGSLAYRGLADITLVFGEAPGLGRTAEWPGINVVLERSGASSPISVEVGSQLGVDLLKGPTISRVIVKLSDGTVHSGTMRMIGASGQYFEMNVDGVQQ
ncbi:hypothetical protein ACW9IK_15770 [Pseudomonas gingeri]